MYPTSVVPDVEYSQSASQMIITKLSACSVPTPVTKFPPLRLYILTAPLLLLILMTIARVLSGGTVVLPFDDFVQATVLHSEAPV